MEIKELKTPLKEENIVSLQAGDRVTISGVVYTARDASHRKIVDSIEKGQDHPVDFTDQIVYYAGPSPATKGRVIGSIGPTTSHRMDVYTEHMLKLGVKGFIGKGRRSLEVRKALSQYKAVYFVAFAGIGALLSQHVGKAEIVGYPELGPEAIFKLTLTGFPVVVADDIHGQDLFEMEWKRWKK